MSFTVEWPAAAEAQWRRLPSLRVQEEVARAVHGFAVTGDGRIERLAGGRVRLRVGGVDVVLGVDATTRTIHVLGVYVRP